MGKILGWIGQTLCVCLSVCLLSDASGIPRPRTDDDPWSQAGRVAKALPTVVVLYGNEGPPVFDRRSLEDRLRFLLETHPIEEIREGFLDRVAVRFVPNKDLNAMFMVLEPEDYLLDGELVAGRPLPLLTIDPFWLAELDGMKDVLYAWLVLAHEHRHYRQFLEEQDPDLRRRFYAWEAFTRGTPEQTRALCVALWRNEKTAYQEECRFAKAWRILDRLHMICSLHVESVGFEQELHRLWVDSAAKNLLAVCRDAIAREVNRSVSSRPSAVE